MASNQFFFYDGITSNMRQFVEMMCNGEFMSKSPDDAWDYFDLLAENAQVWETTNTIEREKPGPSSKGGLYHLKEENDVNSRIAKLTRKVEAIELGKTESKAPTYFENSCGICETNSHLTKDCPTIPAFQEVLHEQANVANAYRRPFSSPYSETYNSNWQNHPNFSWRNGPSINESQGSSSHAPYVPPHKKSLEDTLQAFIQGQTQINQAVMQDIQELKNSVGRIDSKLNVREKGTFPAQPQPNPKISLRRFYLLRKIKKLRMMMGLMIRKIKKMRKESSNLLHLFLKLFLHIKRRKQIKIF
jgi:hypothetical protein